MTAQARPACDASTRQHRPAARLRLGIDLAAQRALADAGGPAQHDAAGALRGRQAHPGRDLGAFLGAADERRAGGLQAGHALFVQRFGLRVGRNTQALLQGLAQVRVPAQRGGAVAGVELALHQRAMARLVFGLELRQTFPLGAGAQQLKVARAQPLAGRLGPRFVARAGQHVAGVGLGGLGTGRCIAPGQCGVGPALEVLRRRP